MNPPRGRSLNSKWVSCEFRLQVMSPNTLDKEGEDRFCHFVEKMPPVSPLELVDEAAANSQKPEGMVRLFDRGVRFFTKEEADDRTTTPPTHLMPS